MKEKKNLLKTIALVVITVIAGNIGPRCRTNPFVWCRKQQ